MKKFLLIGKMFFLCFNLYAGIMVFDLNHDSREITVENIGEFQLVLWGDASNQNAPGSPALPIVTKGYLIPPTSRVIGVEIQNPVWVDLGKFNIMPSQQPTPVGQIVNFTPPDPVIYQNNNYYPEQQVCNFTTGNKSGFMIGLVSYSPFRYHPVSRQLQLLTSAQMVIHYAEGLEEMVYLTPRQHQVFSEDIKSLVVNDQDVNSFSPLIKEKSTSNSEYIIVAPAGLISSLDPLIRWKIIKGVGAQVVSLTWVTSNFSGYDNMEKIREFAKTYHQQHGLIYLVLAGDFDNLGARMIPVDCGSSYSDNTPSDLYFSDVVPYTSDWDANNNHIYGEYQVDSCDYFSDVYVGRFPLNTISEAQLWVNKVLAYEQNPPANFIEKSIMGGAGLWFSVSPPYQYWGNYSGDSIADTYLPSSWTDLKMYQSDTISCPSGFADSLSQGYHWCYIAAHGAPSSISWYVYQNWPNIISNSLMDNLTNGNRLFVIHSMACQPGWFDNQECVGEHAFNASNGGAIAVMFNARYGWGYPPYLGPSEYMCIRTAEELFQSHRWNIGRAHGIGKDRLINWSWGFNDCEHWCVNELNLFGDPETQIYSRDPVSLSVINEDTVYAPSGMLKVDVSSSGSPVEGACCCLCDPYDTLKWFRDYTNSSGIANIHYIISSPDTLLLTVYAHDYLYYQDTVVVDTSQGSNVLTYWSDQHDSTTSFSWGASGGYFGMGYRFTPVELTPVNGWYMKKVVFYLTGGSNSANDANVAIYGPGTPVSPGTMLTSVPFTVSGDTGWQQVELGAERTEVQINGAADMWVEVGFTHAPNDWPFYCCYGNCHVPLQSDLYTNGSSWGYMSQYGYNISWAIRVLVEDASGVEQEIGIDPPHQLILTSDKYVVDQQAILSFSVPLESWVSLKLYDASGRAVATLLDQQLTCGRYQLDFRSGEIVEQEVGAGIYFVRLNTDYGSRVIKLNMVK
ncbi:MAG: C25 family cysteine peptidase [bacterium]